MQKITFFLAGEKRLKVAVEIFHENFSIAIINNEKFH